jgi:hypothetical protein
MTDVLQGNTKNTGIEKEKIIKKVCRKKRPFLSYQPNNSNRQTGTV